MTPYYRRTVGKAREHGQTLFMVDSDGDIRKLIPSWLAVGVNGFVPCEVAAGMDVGEIRQAYGRDVLLFGGIDKRALATGGDALKREIERRARVAADGGYIPAVDHNIPPDVSWANFCEFVAITKSVYGVSAEF